MRSDKTKVRAVTVSSMRFLRDCGHYAMTLFWAGRLILNRKDTKPTYKYCWHLDRTTPFRNRFKSWLGQDPSHSAFWTERRMFVDDLPDPESFRTYPPGTVGRCFYEMCRLHDTKGLLDLRARRLEVLPGEARGLDLEALKNLDDEDERFERILARRNIFMTSTHDLCHMLTGSDTDVAGEAVVAWYQYRHLLVPQNWMNSIMAQLAYGVTFRWPKVREILSTFPAIERSANYAMLDFSKLWRRPLAEVRKELNLPEEGFMPVDRLGGPGAMAH